ncbi:unnamed protein product [Rotaria sp. Silwood2]|nr:unnamed protein product [Rotaria sp. Silwood2]CAF3219223.1 unnamed protein product [Rotaria sp. Silwood2]CAF4106556.1 unnamed protein product [Rotaria sp. Silwood2]CAF4359132.1 unnamed protein product [Rotaria sp. Silwood2]CAF4542946.1 unnamed protein product [Rotaria sp. Silwood2]
MATNDDLDDFFKKKDRKGNKHKKPTGILTNNEELLKQLVIVTSATSAFKENMDFDEEDEDTGINNQNRRQLNDESNGIVNVYEDNQTLINKSRPHVISTNNKNKNSTKLTVQDNQNNINEQPTGIVQQDEWEEFENSNPKYDQLRLKFSRGTNDHNHSDEDEDDDYYDDGHNTNNHDLNTDANTNNIGGDNDEQSSRNNNRRREQQKDKPVWKLDQVKQTELIQTNETVDSKVDKVAELPSKPATTASGVYRPPQLRSNSSVTIVSGFNQRTSKKEKPNLASTEEFPTLEAAINKK